MVRYYADRYRTGGDYWWDFHDDQFVFGHKDKETKDQIYLVDVEPYMREANPRNKGSEDVLRRISDVFELSKESEKNFQNRLGLRIRAMSSKEHLRVFAKKISILFLQSAFAWHLRKMHMIDSRSMRLFFVTLEK